MDTVNMLSNMCESCIQMYLYFEQKKETMTTFPLSISCDLNAMTICIDYRECEVKIPSSHEALFSLKLL